MIGWAAAAFVGQWVWSRADLLPLREVRAERQVAAAVWVGTLSFHRGELGLTRALSPDTAGAGAAAVLRFDDSVAKAFDAFPDDALAARLAALLPPLPAEEVQLDFDCPVRLLPRWALLLSALAPRLAGHRVWITTLPAHLEQPDFGGLFRGRVEGQILQLFDTGAGPEEAERLAERLGQAGLPFRIGLGAFERYDEEGRSTGHRRWLSRLGPFRALPGFEGLWVFPAGRRWRAWLPEVP